MGPLILTVAAILIAAVYKASSNAFHLWKTRRLFKRYEEYMRLGAKGPEAWKFVERTGEIVDLFKRAGIQDRGWTEMRPIGYGYGQQQTARLFDNIQSSRSEIAALVIAAFHRAIGYYRARIREAANPFYWVDTIVFLPAKLVAYLGLPEGSLWGKVANASLWVATVGSFVFSSAFTDATKAFTAFFARLFS
jgi:hypothetical protein